jgi:hypothetical protein
MRRDTWKPFLPRIPGRKRVLSDFDKLVKYTKTRLDTPEDVDIDFIEFQMRRAMKNGWTVEQVADRGNLIAIALVNVKFRKITNQT